MPYPDSNQLGPSGMEIARARLREAILRADVPGVVNASLALSAGELPKPQDTARQTALIEAGALSVAQAGVPVPEYLGQQAERIIGSEPDAR